MDLRDNLLTGHVPETLDKVPHLGLTGNRITSVPEEFCLGDDDTNSSSSAETNTSCSTLLCPPGTWNVDGRASDSSDSCAQCPLNNASPYYGSTSCGLVDERSLLVEFFDSCSGSNWYRNDFWTTHPNICDWYGVGCSTHGKVIVLNLQGNNLQCDIPLWLFELPYLEALYLNDNRITIDLENLSTTTSSTLSELRLSGTRVSSLAGIAHLQSLAILDASLSNLTGRLPDELMALKNLRVLNVRDNRLSGKLPPLWGQLRYLRILRLDNNAFSGPLPTFADSEALTHVFLANNALTGSIPANLLWRVSSSELPLVLDVSDNQLVGAVPLELARFASMRLLLAGNRVESISPSLCDPATTAAWNDGDIRRFGCDGILCPPGTSNDWGRHSVNVPCIPCRVGPSAAASTAKNESWYYGQRSCPNITSGGSRGHVPASSTLSWWMTVTVLGGLWAAGALGW